MSVRKVKAGSTDVSITLRIIDSTDGTPETGVTFETSGIDLWYRRDLAASVDITEATLAALTTAHADGGFLHINDGVYRLDLPDAACAAGVAGVQIGGTITGMVVLAPYIELPVNTEEDVYTRIGAPAGASVSADIAAIEAQTDDIGAAGAGLTAADDAILTILGTPAGASLAADVAAVKVDTAAILVDTGTTLDGKIDTIDTNVDAILVDTGTTLQGELDAIEAAVITNAAGVDIAADIIAMKADTAAILVDTGTTLDGRIPAALVSGRMDSSVGAMAANVMTAAAAAADLTTELQNGLATAAALDTVDNFLDTEIAAILEDTGTTLDDLVDDLEGRLTAALATALTAHSLALGRVVVDAGSSTTEVVFKSVNGAAASAVNDFYNGRVLIFTSGALTLQASDITDYVGASVTATVTALTGAPAEDVTAVLV